MEKVENARVSDAGTAAGEAAGREMSGLKQESMKLDMEEIQKKLGKIEQFIDNKGQIKAPVDGVVVDTGLQAGDRICLLYTSRMIKVSRLVSGVQEPW